ncbi:hypothetical protein CTA1_3118 [Colletotrichum tanaceti]|uniref:Uncharacterized protein n=1 Tax=Colletotrichum tanaceti TaxID=1306861 RepID=A0A4U6XVG0_9PEZI|nr:hypothetical protein CTA1_3118 [Colletotrichum tanaceti]
MRSDFKEHTHSRFFRSEHRLDRLGEEHQQHQFPHLVGQAKILIALYFLAGNAQEHDTPQARAAMLCQNTSYLSSSVPIRAHCTP